MDEKKNPAQQSGGVRLKGAWQVVAGVLPGTAMPEYTKTFAYTSNDREADECHSGLANYQPIYCKVRAEALDYYAQMCMPHLNNWAKIEYIWY